MDTVIRSWLPTCVNIHGLLASSRFKPSRLFHDPHTRLDWKTEKLLSSYFYWILLKCSSPLETGSGCGWGSLEMAHRGIGSNQLLLLIYSILANKMNKVSFSLTR